MDITVIKNEIRDFLVKKLSPQATVASYEAPLSDGSYNYTLAQSFKLFSTCFRPSRSRETTNLPVTLSLVKYGTPSSGVKVTLQASNSTGLPSGIDIALFRVSPSEVYGSQTLVTKNLVLTDYLSSKLDYYLVISPEFSTDPTNYIALGRNNVDSGYSFGTCKRAISGFPVWVDQSYDICFKIVTPGWIYTDYPRTDLNLKSYPRLTVDITSRRVEVPYISHQIADYIMTLQLTMYSEYLDELDLILSKADQQLFENRISFTNFNEYLPGSISGPAVARQNLISRVLTSTIKKREGPEVTGQALQNKGIATFSGDGTTTTFQIPHGLSSPPTHVSLEAKSGGAVGDKYWSADATNITVTFVTAPPTGTNNVVIGWRGEV